jgi:hypothetical protein
LIVLAGVWLEVQNIADTIQEKVEQENQILM